MRRKWKSVLVGLMLGTVLVLALPEAGLAAPAKNVIILMTDGTGVTHTTLTRWYLGGGLLPQDPYIVGAMRTYCANSIITDSAPAASAFATGHKTDDKFISVLPVETNVPGLKAVAKELQYKPVASVLEGAKLCDKAAGIVATSNVQHASPAAFSAHWADRNNYEEIAEQQVYLNVDVMLGGGRQYLLPQEQGGTRKDGENLIAALKARGYAFVENGKEMEAYKGGKLWGLFAPDALAYEMDRKTLHPEQPSLAEMTDKAIEVLNKNKNGFFLFVEASKVDWASHSNDPIGVISDTKAYADAIKVALDFAKRDGNTLVLCFADHSNGGMAIGSEKSDKTYSETSYQELVEPLKKAVLTGEGVEAMLGGNRSEEAIKDIVGRYYGIDDLTEQEMTALQKAKVGRMNSVLGPIISKRSIIGWTTTGHTGEDVLLYAYGPNKPGGLVENTRIAYHTAESMGFDLDRIDERLFVEAGELFKGIDANISIDRKDQANPVLVVEKNGKTARLPFSKNLIEVNAKSFEMTGIVVLAEKSGKVYLPRQALDILRQNGF